MEEQNTGWAGQPDDVAWAGPDGHFKLRAGAIVRDDDRILLCAVDGLDGWFLPGGKVGFGETAATAIARELREELGLELSVGELLLVTEDFLPLNGILHQEVCFYYAVPWPESVPPAVAHKNPEFEHSFRWVRLSELPGVDLLPPQLREHLMNDTTELRHLAIDRRSPTT